MKNSLKALVTSAMLAMTLVPAATSISQAKATYSITKISGEGFRKCKAQGDSGYTAIVRGTTLSESNFNQEGFGKFFVRSCFQTKAECSHFVNRFSHIVAGVNKIDYTACKSRA